MKHYPFISSTRQGGERFRAGVRMQADASWKVALAPGIYTLRKGDLDAMESTPYPDPLVIEKGKGYDAVVLKYDQGGGGDLKK